MCSPAHVAGQATNTQRHCDKILKLRLREKVCRTQRSLLLLFCSRSKSKPSTASRVKHRVREKVCRAQWSLLFCSRSKSKPSTASRRRCRSASATWKTTATSTLSPLPPRAARCPCGGMNKLVCSTRVADSICCVACLNVAVLSGILSREVV